MTEEVKKVCVSCKTSDTPLWRLGPQGPKTMCNACGIKWKRRMKGGSVSSSAPKKRKRTEPSTSSPKKPRVSKMKIIVASSSSESENVSIGPTSDEEESIAASPAPVSSPEGHHPSTHSADEMASSPPMSSSTSSPPYSGMHEDRTITMADYSVEFGIGRGSLRTRHSSSPVRISSPALSDDHAPSSPSKRPRRESNAASDRKRELDIEAIPVEKIVPPKKRKPHVPSSLSTSSTNTNSPVTQKKKTSAEKVPSKRTPMIGVSTGLGSLISKSTAEDDGFGISFKFPASELKAKRGFFDIACFELERLEEEMKYNQEVSHFKEELQILKDQLHQRDIVLANLLHCLSEANSDSVSKSTLLSQLPSEIVPTSHPTSPPNKMIISSSSSVLDPEIETL